MQYSGQVKNGMVVFDDPPPLEDGTVVRVEPVETPGPASETAAKLLGVAGKAKEFPKDLARNHDHYLHGQPKK
jgi:hypothetical protein